MRRENLTSHINRIKDRFIQFLFLKTVSFKFRDKLLNSTHIVDSNPISSILAFRFSIVELFLFPYKKMTYYVQMSSFDNTTQVPILFVFERQDIKNQVLDIMVHIEVQVLHRRRQDW